MLATASAQRWTIQAFAFGHSSRAAATVQGLREVGFDAYTDAATEGSLVEVRIGCFSAQADAAALVQDVRLRVAADALVVPFREGAAATVCVERVVGFIPPAAWGVASANEAEVTFWLEATGRRYITFDGERWQLQGGAVERATPPEDTTPLTDRLAPARPEGLPVGFRATQSRGLPLVRADLGGGSLLITAGELLWSSTQAAVVKQGADVFALRLQRP